MDPKDRNENAYEFEIETLKSMFGDLISPAVIVAILESCKGDLNAAAEGIMNMTSDKPINSEENAQGVYEPSNSDQINESLSNPTAHVAPIVQIQNPNMSEHQEDIIPPPTTYAAAYKNTGAVPKSRYNQPPRFSKNKQSGSSYSEQMDKIIKLHHKGSRVLILMRGLPGSGKTTLARQIVENTVGPSMQYFVSHCFSADDYFIVRGKYQYNRSLLQEAHIKTQKKVWSALNHGVSPVIVDNTNVQVWEMEPYLRDGVKNGYLIEIVEADTPWAKNANQLAKKNIHNVPRDKIKIMLERYEHNVTPSYLFKCFNLSYPPHLKPPVVRKIPSFTIENIPCSDIENTPQINKTQSGHAQFNIESETARKPTKLIKIKPYTYEESTFDSNTGKAECRSVSESEGDDLIAPEDEERLQKLLESQKKFQEMQMLEKEWDDGECWEAAVNVSTPEITDINASPKPPRSFKEQKKDIDEPLIKASNICDDWSQIAMYMPEWPNQQTPTTTNERVVSVETTSTGTCFEIGDVDNIYHLYREIIGTPRDINENINLNKREKIPAQRMLDKSTSTHEHNVVETHRCKNEEKHFIAFKKMFKDVPRPVLRDIFDKCLGDVNWAVNIVLDSLGSNPLEVGITDVSDTEEEEALDCNCLAAYSVIPDQKHCENPPTETVTINEDQEVASSSLTILKRQKRERKNSEKSLQLKRQIESNVIISENHYSQHHLNLRKARGEISSEPVSFENLKIDDVQQSLTDVESIGVVAGSENTTKIEIDNDTAGACALDVASDNVGDETNAENFFNFLNEKMFEAKIGVGDKVSDNMETYDDKSVTSEVDNVSVNIGMEFVHKLDQLFGRSGIIYSENVKPVINIPTSLLSEINALWVESIAYQMSMASRQTDEMLKQDEEFARQLALKEKQMAEEGKESKLPDFRELMDMELALSIYQKDVADWKNNEPTDLAAKMSREKLFDLFPDILEDTLSELLMAHGNNFRSTVESLLISTGQGHLLETPDGVNKFIMEKGFEKKAKELADQQETLSESEWPFLPNQKVDLDTVNHFREEAERYLISRNDNFNKARYFYDKNQLQVASFYSDIASYNKQKYERANSLAAASLIQFHAGNSPSKTLIDLHYLRVVEAKEALDIFIDSKIQQLRAIKEQGYFPKALPLFIVTGRGAHSPGAPRIKPAVMKRLEDRELRYEIKNPGLLSTKVTYNCKTSNELNRARNG